MKEVLSCAGLGKCISGTILFEETLYDKCGTGETFIELLKKQVRMPPPLHLPLFRLQSRWCWWQVVSRPKMKHVSHG